METQFALTRLLGALWLTSAIVQAPPVQTPETDVALYQPFCIPGVLGTIPCPCSNPPAGGGLGCDNFSAGPAASGTLSAFGAASLSNDSLVLTATGENNTSLTAFWQGTDPTNPVGVVHGAGVRCVDGPLRKLYVGSAAGGALSRPGAGDPGVSARSASLGDPIPLGAGRHYFNTYRDPNAAVPCGRTASTINLTNALTVFWGP